MNAIPDIFHFSIFREPHLDPKREAERQVLMRLLLRLDGFIKFSDVTFGQDPPDFVFHHQDRKIGVELTDLNPKGFNEHGHLKRAEYKTFEADLAQTSSANESFSWDVVSPRESIGAFKKQLETKREKARPWASKFSDCWLLIHAVAGNPFAIILNPKLEQTTPAAETALAAHVAKMTQAIHSLCQNIEPFSHVILFRRSDHYADCLAFSTANSNPYNFPVPADEILNHGAKVPDAILDLKTSPRTVIKKTTYNF
jgi:hypothetical protein